MTDREGAGRFGRCEMVLLVQAEFDGELDAGQAAALAAHRAGCAVCQAAGQQLARTRALMNEGLREPLPDAARQRILAALDAARPAPAARKWSWLRAWRAPSAGFALGAACAAALAFLMVTPGGQPDLTAQVIAGHIRALQPGHLEDVVSTDQHTVKPWFAGKLDFSPPVKELAPAGFPLKGGRLDYLDGREVAALVYQHDKHIIDLFVWPESGGPGGDVTAQHDGYNVVHWRANGMVFWAVSDIERRRLRDFADAWQRTP